MEQVSLCSNRPCRWAYMQGTLLLLSFFHLLSCLLDALKSPERQSGQVVLTGEISHIIFLPFHFRPQ